jgi:hypothetical protein
MKINSRVFSRAPRLAANLHHGLEEEWANLFVEKQVLIGIEPAFALVQDARETFLFTVNQVLRFCPNVVLSLPAQACDLASRSLEVAKAIHGAGDWIRFIKANDELHRFDAVISIGTRVHRDPRWITINSSGWLARIATGTSKANEIPWFPAPGNACGSLASACLATGAGFLSLIGQPSDIAQEISLFTHRQADLGVLNDGPGIPGTGLQIDAFLVGCGAVTNGWAYTIKRFPVSGKVQAIDRQSLQVENLGPYVLATRGQLRAPKAQIIADYLKPAIDVISRPEEWELFKIRIKYGLTVPSLIVNGLDHVGTRHSVQRLWPDKLIDMAAGGLTTQVIVKSLSTNGLCLLRALDIPSGEIDWAERLALETGLSAERIRNDPVTEIAQADIDSAAPGHRQKLRKSRGKLICGRVTEQNLWMEAENPNFAPAVPFVTAFSGIVGAAETLKDLMGFSVDIHYQRHFHSNRSRALELLCRTDCECQKSSNRLDSILSK